MIHRLLLMLSLAAYGFAVDDKTTEIIASEMTKEMVSRMPVELQKIKLTTVYEIDRTTKFIVKGKVFNKKGVLVWYDKLHWNSTGDMIGSDAYDSNGVLMYKNIQYKTVGGEWNSIIIDSEGHQLKEEDVMARILKLESQ